jgi:hypothetical protein
MGFAILHLKFALEGQESPQAGLRPAWPCAGYGPAHNLESNASNIQRSLRNECFPVDSNVKIAKNTGPLRHSKKICLDNNKI